MARKQLQIAGTERTDVPAEILEAGEKWLGLRTDKRRIAEKAKEAKFGLIVLMQARKVAEFRYRDPETGETRSLSVDLEPKLSVRKVSEDAAAEGPDNVDAKPSSPDVHPGLIAQAEKAQADAGVAETSEGDVVPTDASVPKAKRNGKRKASN
jgi:hypothetical protein